MPTKNLQKFEKRKREDSAKAIETVSERKRAVSSTTVNSSDSPIDRQTKKARKISQPKSPKTRSQPPRNQETSDARACLLCPKRRTITTGVMIECDTEGCGLWYHGSCIFRAEKKPRKVLLFSTNQGMNGASFICPSCLDQRDGSKSGGITHAIRSMVDKVTSLPNKEGTTPFEKSQSPHPEEEVSPPLSNLQLLDHSLENEQWHEGGSTILQRSRNEKYQGFNKSVIDDLVRTLDACIFNYNKEVCDVVEWFGDSMDDALHAPLKSWNLIDAKGAMLTGQKWYEDQSSNGIIPPTVGHAPITASLRQMLQLKRDAPLEIAESLQNLTFSHVYQAFISWFVIDILGNNLDIFELPNMKPMRAMMTGVHQFVEERWPGQGRRVLREVQLRTWEKSAFEEDLRKNAKYISGKLEMYLEPLTKQFNKVTPWSHQRLQLIETTIRLWSYFEAPNGKFMEIRPVIGSYFDSTEQEGYWENGDKYVPDKRSKAKVLWISRRGFRYAEEETGTTLVKAIVLVH